MALRGLVGGCTGLSAIAAVGDIDDLAIGFIRWPLDHLFHSNHFTLSRICRLRGFGSDLFALFTELVLEVGRDDQESHLRANKDDLAWAKEKADEQSVSKKDVLQPETDYIESNNCGLVISTNQCKSLSYQ
jgi:hypothetical protein